VSALGFTEAWSRDKLAQFELGQFTFFLQDFFAKEWVENMMMDLAVADVDAYYSYLQGLKLVERFPRKVRISAPADDGTGVRRGHFVDPSGVLWHFSQTYERIST
jgi:hypothetical protein